MQKIIAFVGMMGSGKGTAVTYFTNLGFPEVYFGGMVYEEVERRGLDRVKDEIFVRQDMRNKEGAAVLAKRATNKARELFDRGEQIVVFDGLYSWPEYTYLRSVFGQELLVVALIADRKIRHQRVLNRKDGRIYTPQEIIDREINEVETMNKGGPIAIADRYLYNNGSIVELEQQLEKLASTLKTT